MNTKQYYYLTTIADYGNLSHAARALSVSPSALSKFLAECEHTFGLVLFLRYGRRLYPTAAGRYVVDCARNILDEQNRMLLTMKTVTGSNRNRIRLATAPNRGAIIYSKIYKQFSRRYPGIALNLTELYASEQPAAIARGRIDLALGAGAVSELVTDVPIAREQLLVSLPVSHPLAGQSAIRLADLRDTPFVLQGHRHSIRLLAEQLFHEAGFQPVVAFESDDVMLVDSMMHQAVGVGLVSKAHVFPCEELAYRPLDPPVYQTLHLRYPLGHTLSEPERYLAGLLAAERLADPRYETIDSPAVQEILQLAMSSPDTAGESSAAAQTGAALQSLREVNLDSKVLEYLIAIVDEQGLSRAAERFYLAQSALSRHLRGVEDMVGTTLFERQHNRLRPTSAGTIFINNARNMLRIEQEMFSRIRSYQAGRGGRLYLSCDPLVAPLLRRLQDQAFRPLHPEMELVLREENQAQTVEALQNASADLGIFVSTTPRYPLLQCEVLALTELVYCFAPAACPQGWQPGEPFPAGLPPRPQLLAAAGSTLRSEQDALLAQVFDTPAPTACEAQPSILQQLANLGISDAVLPLNLLQRRHHQRCAAFEPPKPLYLLLAHHVGRPLTPAAQQLCGLIHSAAADVMALPDKTDDLPL